MQATPVKRKRRTADPASVANAAREKQLTLAAREHADGAAAKSKKNAGSNSQIATRLASLSIMATSQHDIIDAEVYPASHDDCLLEQARTQWQFGDWESLANLNSEVLQHHPERAKLALLAAAGHLQRGNSKAARQFIHHAHDWGCTKKLISQILIAGVHNSLGRASAISGHQPSAMKHFENAITLGTPRSDVRLNTEARTLRQRAQLGLEVVPRVASALPGTASYFQTASPEATPGCPTWIHHLVQDCLAATDIHEKIDAVIASQLLSSVERFFFFTLISEYFRERKDNLTATHFLSVVLQHEERLPTGLRINLVKTLLKLGVADIAVDVFFKACLEKYPEATFSNEEKSALYESYNKSRASYLSGREHGHEVLLGYLGKHLAQLRPALGTRRPIFVEVGSTRENVPGQGSTSKIAEFCKRNGCHFITVDMDIHNTRMAESTFRRMKCHFEAINKKGEEYLLEFTGLIDFIFLDAYDFDHGNHSFLRQSRYKKFLSAEISNTECHKMHLNCAQSVAGKLSRHGLVCIDDTWLQDGKWAAKGTLAVPYLLDNEFELIETRNRAALLKRKQSNNGSNRNA